MTTPSKVDNKAAIDLDNIAKRIFDIYREKFKDAVLYLEKARKIKDKFGSSFSVVYCWFYSVPQKWTLLEPKIFTLAEETNNFDLRFILETSPTRLAKLMKSLMFYNKLSFQLKNFCEVIRGKYASWDNFAEELRKESIFKLFTVFNKYNDTRITFKNLAAMKIFIGNEDDLLILDKHVANVLGINKNDLYKYRKRKESFKSILEIARLITKRLIRYGLTDVTMAKWSLSIWFYETKISGDSLLKNLN
ncbi:MAG: hypothetical protein QXO15_08740 [Nitrososphaerota archaeon]